MWKAREMLLAAVLVTVLAACGPSAPSESAVQTAIAQTEAAQPTPIPVTTEAPPPTAEPTETAVPTDTPEPTSTPEPTATSEPTRIPLSQVDIGSPLFRSGDLPRHLSPTVFSMDELLTQNIYLEDIPFGVNFINVNLHNENSGSTGGAVIVYVYDDVGTAEQVYRTTSRVVDEEHNLLGMFGFTPRVGDQSKGASSTPQVHLTFRRCSTVVYIWMVDVTEDQITAYAQRLDGRLADVVCPAGE